MEADFSGYATKNGLKCTDGRTIMPNAFQHNDKAKVPLVWQHQHNEPANILGHVMLENREDGVYAHGYFNETDPAKQAKNLVQHGDIVSMSIYANNLTERNKNVMHGDIREVSLVLSGANPGALIEHVNLVHGDQIETLVDEAVIYTGLELTHSDESSEAEDLEHAETTQGDTAVADTKEKTVQDIFDEMNEEQQNVVYYLIAEALNGGDGAADGETTGGTAAQSGLEDVDEALGEDPSVEDVFNTLSHKQQEVMHFLISEALKEGTSEAVSHSDVDDKSGDDTIQHSQEDSDMSGRNVFDQTTELNGSATSGPEKRLTHGQLETIVTEAQKNGSFKDALLAHAAEYGIENIDVLFPDAKSLTNSPEIIGRRTEWVNDVINGTRHSPFSRIKSTAVDLTADEARAKGYVKGNLKKDEIVKLLKRVTVPTTIYKKQKLDRDDIVDITDLDVVAWLKAEMRLMLDEEIARAILIGDGRESDDEDKINEDHIRPIAYDADMYAHQVTIGGDLTADAIVEGVLRARTFYKGTGTPTFYTTDGVLTDLILAKDKMGRRLYGSETELAAALRVDKVVTVEVMEDAPELVGIVVNLADYTIGADRGGAVSLFDDFDIDYNQYKYLIETRISGTLTKPKSALVIKRTVGTVVTPATPSYNGTTHKITIPTTAGVVYSVEGVDKTGDVTISETSEVDARPAQGYTFPTNVTRQWVYTFTA